MHGCLDLKNALKVLQKQDGFIQETPSIIKKLDKEKVTDMD